MEGVSYRQSEEGEYVREKERPSFQSLVASTYLSTFRPRPCPSPGSKAYEEDS